jgi:hypothetical protein
MEVLPMADVPDPAAARPAERIGDQIEQALLRELRRWDGGDSVTEVAGQLVPYLRRSVLRVLRTEGIL